MTASRIASRLPISDHDAGRDTGRADRLLEGAARGRPLLAHDHALALQVGQRDRIPGREGMVGAGEDDDRMAAVGHRQQPRILVDMGQHRHVGAIVAQVLERAGRVAERHAQLHARIAPAEGGQHLGHVIGPDRADPQHAAAQLARLLQELQRLALLREHAGGDGEQVAAGRRQLDPAVAAMEQPHVELRLQGADLRGQRRLADAELLGRGGEAARLRDRLEGSQPRVTHR